MLSVIMLNVTYKPFMLSVVMLNGVMLNVVMLNVVMLNVVIVNVVILIAEAPDINKQNQFIFAFKND